MTLVEILDRLNRPNVEVERLLDECRALDLTLWQQYPELYLVFVQRLIEQGHPARALDLAREGEQFLKDNIRLQYQLALAAARGGNPRLANVLLEPLLNKATDESSSWPQELGLGLRVDIIALKGRILKDQSVRHPELAKESAVWYEKAAAVVGPEDPPDVGAFPLINAATMWRIAGDLEKSQTLAAEVVERVEPTVETALTNQNIWPAATLGEALMLLGQHEQSVDNYLKAIQLANTRGDLGSLAAIRNNLRRLEDVGATADPSFLDEYLGTVVVFSGHPIDSPDRRDEGLPPRFPDEPGLEPAVKQAIRDKLNQLNAKVGYCSLASGGDILFAEAMLERKAELHVVLPFAQSDYLRMRVDYGQAGPKWRNWRMRFDKIMAQLETNSKNLVRYTTSEPYLGSDELFGFTNCMLQGLALLRSRTRASIPRALVLVDHDSPDEPGGTRDFCKVWSTSKYSPCEEIDLAELRAAHSATSFADGNTAATPQVSTLKRPVKAMLFADVAKFSGIKEWQMASFLTEYQNYLRKLFASDVGQKAVYFNTWGDGLYVVFDDVVGAARFATELVEPTLVTPIKWEAFGLGKITPFRVGLHKGPVFELEGLFQGRSEFAGQHVNRAARIEPVTIRGCAYASEPFAAVLMMEAGDKFAIESVGEHSLAKDYDRCPLYRLQSL